jgi:hypothetical protein
MKKIVLSVAATILLCPPALAQLTVPIELATRINNAACLNDWNTALNAIQQLIGNSNITPEYRQQLIAYRARFEDWRATGQQFDQSNNPNCSEAIAHATENAPHSEQSPVLDWGRAADR